MIWFWIKLFQGLTTTSNGYDGYELDSYYVLFNEMKVLTIKKDNLRIKQINFREPIRSLISLKNNTFMIGLSLGEIQLIKLID